MIFQPITYSSGDSGAPENSYVRPSDWLALPTNITETDQTFVALHAILPSGQNYCAFRFITSTGNYQVDWGDGVIETFASNVTAEHNYNYATYDVSNTTLSTRGYKQAIITVTPVSGNLLTCNFQIRYTTSPVQNQAYATGFLDCILSMPNANASGITFGGSIIRHTYCEIFTIKTIGNCTNISNMFSNCFSLQSVPLFNTASVTSMPNMFNNCYTLQSVPLFNTTSVTNMLNMFWGCYALQSVPLFNTPSAIDMSGMFNTCFSLQSVPLFNTTLVTNMSSMFSNCNALQSVPLFNTSSVTNMSSMFSSSYALQSVPLFNTASVTNMSNMFSSCFSLQSVPLFNTASVTNMSSMFTSCFSLQSVPLFNTASVTNMSSMFSNCRLFQSVPLFNTTLVTNMSSMFSNCYTLQSVPLFNTSSVTNMSSMFSSCYTLQSVPLFNTALVTNMSGMFTSCNSLDRCEIIGRLTISFSSCQLSRTALVEIFTNLLNRTSLSQQTIDITANWGASALTTQEREIATNKNWLITG